MTALVIGLAMIVCGIGIGVYTMYLLAQQRRLDREQYLD